MSNFSVNAERNPLSGKERLGVLYKTGEYVFHGSTKKLTVLNPHQQWNFNQEKGEPELDGDPAVCAALNPEIANFMVLTSIHVAKELGLSDYYTDFGVKDKSCRSAHLSSELFEVLNPLDSC